MRAIIERSGYNKDHWHISVFDADDTLIDIIYTPLNKRKAKKLGRLATGFSGRFHRIK